MEYIKDKMSGYISKSTSMDRLLDEYMERNQEKSFIKKKQGASKKYMKIPLEQTVIPTIHTYQDLHYINYNMAQLKSFAKYYKLKQSGNKSELTNRIYNHLYFSHYAVKIQTYMRGFLVRTYIKTHGPAGLNRSLCTNVTDFITMEPLEEIPFHQFISFKDTDDFIYGFDIVSLHNLLLKKNSSSEEIQNPYNRMVFPKKVLNDIGNMIRIGKVLRIDINLEWEDIYKSITLEKSTELRALTFFQTVDMLGNYTNFKWFLSLSKEKLRVFIYELVDIWNYRTSLTIQMKKNICPPSGNPFFNIRMDSITSEPCLLNIQNTLLTIMENLVYYGVDNDTKWLGAFHVLGALTLVNPVAAKSMPWIFKIFKY